MNASIQLSTADSNAELFLERISFNACHFTVKGQYQMKSGAYGISNKIYIFLAVFAAALSGCSNNGDPQERITANEAVVERFTLNGTSEPLLPSHPKPISPTQNGGRFEVSWEISADGVVDVELAVRPWDDDFRGCLSTEEYEFFDDGCGGGQDCAFVDGLSCVFGTDNSVACDGGRAIDLTEFLDEIPKEAAVTIVARSLSGTDCSSEHVEFQ